jgi:hypothetical protein
MDALHAFFPGMRLQYKEHTGTFEERGDQIVLVGNSGTTYTTLEDFWFGECGELSGNPWDACEFWKSWAWWKCNEMLPPKI